MAMAICPLAADVGNWADWAAVVVGLGAAAGTIAVARVANRTSKQAAEIALQAALIAKQQLDVTVRTDESNARIVGQLILHEVSDLPCRIWTEYQRVTRQSPYDSEGELLGPNFLSFYNALQDCSAPFLPVSQKVQDRIHLLPEKLGEGLAMLIGLGITLNSISSKMLSLVDVRRPDSRYTREEFRYKGKEEDLEVFRRFLVKYSKDSIEFAEAFGVYVGLKDHPFSRWAIMAE